MRKLYKKIIIAIFLIYFIVTLISQQKTLNQYKSEASTYSEQLEMAKDTNSELQKTKCKFNWIHRRSSKRKIRYVPT